MKIVMLRPSYKPELSAGNHLAINLIEDFIEKGYDVELIVPVSEKFSESEVEDYGYPVHRIQSNFRGVSTIKRILKYIDSSFKMFFKLMNIKDIDIIISHSMPPTLGPLSVLAGKLKSTPVLYWEQDIVSQSILTTGITRSRWIKKLFYNVARMIENISLKGSTHIITISEKFKKLHVDSNILSNKIDVIYNWIDVNKIHPLSREKNYLFDKYNLDRSKFYVTYCGNLGVPQNVEIMIEAANMLKEIEDIRFLIFGGGSREEKVKAYIKNKDLSNLQLFPLEPLGNACEVYNVGNVGLVIAKAGTSNNGFPSKTWSILSAGQAMISCFDLDSELSKFVIESKSGLAIEPDSPEKLRDAILEIYQSEDRGKLYGENARKYVSDNFSRSTATNRFITIIEKVLLNYNK